MSTFAEPRAHEYAAVGTADHLSVATLRLLAPAIAVLFCAGAQAGLFGLLPKMMKEVPKELRGDYVLVARVTLGKSNLEFITNTPPFATVFSNRVVLAGGVARPVETVVRLKQKGTNVHLVSFEGKASWILVPGRSPSEFVLMQNEGEPKGTNPPMLFIRRVLPDTQTNGPAADMGGPKTATSPRRQRK
jgi:hypothetical protein